MFLQDLYNIISQIGGYEITIYFYKYPKQKWHSDVFPYTRDGYLYFNFWFDKKNAWTTTSIPLKNIKKVVVK